MSDCPKLLFFSFIRESGTSFHTHQSYAGRLGQLVDENGERGMAEILGLNDKSPQSSECHCKKVRKHFGEW